MIWIPTISRHWENKFERQANFLHLNDYNMYLHIYFLVFSTYFKEHLRFLNLKMLTNFFFVKKQNRKKSHVRFPYSIISNLMMRFYNLLEATISLDSGKPIHCHIMGLQVDSDSCSDGITQPDNQKQSDYITCSLDLCPPFLTFKTSKQILYKEHNLIFRDVFFWRLPASVWKKLTLCEHTRWNLWLDWFLRITIFICVMK